ncbi:hypothetical protein U9M48_025810 [Paspalum notatum var. saurae]|uniref:Uncharacterized protein n=1 Tax=Paspalum notatum var. saurae TaxID=547442 RepID=A0AAQ3TUK5_PASNO
MAFQETTVRSGIRSKSSLASATLPHRAADQETEFLDGIASNTAWASASIRFPTSPEIMQFHVNTFRSGISSNTRRAAPTLPPRRCAVMAEFHRAMSPACRGGCAPAQKRRRRSQARRGMRRRRGRFWKLLSIFRSFNKSGEE